MTSHRSPSQVIPMESVKMQPEPPVDARDLQLAILRMKHATAERERDATRDAFDELCSLFDQLLGERDQLRSELAAKG